MFHVLYGIVVLEAKVLFSVRYKFRLWTSETLLQTLSNRSSCEIWAPWECRKGTSPLRKLKLTMVKDKIIFLIINFGVQTSFGDSYMKIQERSINIIFICLVNVSSLGYIASASGNSGLFKAKTTSKCLTMLLTRSNKSYIEGSLSILAINSDS